MNVEKSLVLLFSYDWCTFLCSFGLNPAATKVAVTAAEGVRNFPPLSSSTTLVSHFTSLFSRKRRFDEAAVHRIRVFMDQ